MCYQFVALKCGGRYRAWDAQYVWDVVERGCRARWGKINAGIH